MQPAFIRFLLSLILSVCCVVSAAPTNIAEDDAAHSGYSGSWDAGKNGGNGFGAWAMATEKDDTGRHAGFFIASTENNPDLNGIAKEGKAFGLYANGSGFEQAVAYRALNKPLAVGDSFSFMMENGKFEKKGDKEDPGGGSAGLVLRTGNANSSPSDYNTGAMFEFGCYQGQESYQIHDGSEKTDSGVTFTDSGLVVTVTVTGAGVYDLEIQTLSDKNLTKLPDRKFKSSGDIESLAVFNRNSEKNDVYFNQFQITRASE